MDLGLRKSYIPVYIYIYIYVFFFIEIYIYIYLIMYIFIISVHIETDYKVLRGSCLWIIYEDNNERLPYDLP